MTTPPNANRSLDQQASILTHVWDLVAAEIGTELIDDVALRQLSGRLPKATTTAVFQRFADWNVNGKMQRLTQHLRLDALDRI